MMFVHLGNNEKSQLTVYFLWSKDIFLWMHVSEIIDYGMTFDIMIINKFHLWDYLRKNDKIDILYSSQWTTLDR